MKKIEPGYIISYYFNRLRRYAELMKKGFNEESIHLYRVEVKKLRAFLRIIRPAAEDPGQLKFPHKFKKMYSLTGKIRDMQLCLKRIKEYDKNIDGRFRDKINFLEKEIEKLSDKENELLTKNEIIEIEKKIIRHVSIMLDETLLRTFFLHHLNTINKVISIGNYTDKELHDIRKSIKDIIYVNRLFRDVLRIPLPFSFWNDDELKNAENLSHTLGLFNDVCIALSFIPPDEIKKTDAGEKEHLLSLRRKWLGEKQKLKKEILNEMLHQRFRAFRLTTINWPYDESSVLQISK